MSSAAGPAIRSVLLVLLIACGDEKSGLDLASIDSAIDPCDDFYQYACGGWIADNPIPSDGAANRRFDDPFYAAVPRLRSIVEGASSISDRLEVRVLAQHYQACLGAPSMLQTREQLKRLVERISAVETLDELARQAADQRALGSVTFFAFGVGVDTLDTTRYILGLSPRGVELPDRSYYLDPEERALRDRYLRHIEDLSTLVLDQPIDAAAVLRIETALASAFLARDAQRDPEAFVNVMTPAEIIAVAPTFPWQVYWDAVGYGEVDRINVTLPAYLTALEELFTSAPLEELKSYMSWQLIQDRSGELDQGVLDVDFSFWRMFNGRTEPSARDWTCFVRTMNVFELSIARLYYERHFQVSTLEVADEMSVHIRGAFEATLDDAVWLDEATRSEARAKLDALRFVTGPPERWPGLGDLNLDGKSYFDLYTELIRASHQRARERLSQPVDDSEYLIPHVTNNAFYSPVFNAVELGLLMHELPFAGEAPRAFNYGALGSIMGHEVTHGFDDAGRHFDAEGDLRDWWTPESKALFDERAQCLIDQFDGYEPLPGELVNGRLTLGENLADLGGVATAYRAMMLESTGEGGDGFDEAQVFFLANAQAWCGNTRPELVSSQLLTDPHSPRKFRVNGTVSNLSQFREAFECEAGAPMVRADPCAVW